MASHSGRYDELEPEHSELDDPSWAGEGCIIDLSEERQVPEVNIRSFEPSSRHPYPN